MAITVYVGIGVGEAIRDGLLAAFTEQTGIVIARGETATADLLLLDELAVIDRIRAGTLDMLGRRAHRARIDLDNFPQAAIDPFRASDVVYAIPYRIRSLVLIYRTDLIEHYEIAVPTTYDGLLMAAATARRRLAADRRNQVAAFVGPAAGGYNENFRLLGSAIFPAWGWRWHRGNGQPPRVESPATVEALGWYARLLRETGPDDAALLTTASARERFVAGQAIFLIDDARAFMAAQQALGADAVGIATIPAGPSGRLEPGLFVSALCIPTASEQRDAAWELLRVLISPESLLADAIQLNDPEPPGDALFAAAEFADAFAAHTRSVLRISRAHARINRPVIPFAREFGAIVGEAARAVIAGERSPEDALREAQARVDGLYWADERPANLGEIG